MSAFAQKLAQALGHRPPGDTGFVVPTAPVCPYCGESAQLVGGVDIYPHRPDLSELRFWSCSTCQAYVGCHKAGAWIHDADGNRIVSDGSMPLGRLANAELRQAKQRVHEVFDPLWKEAHRRSAARVQAYAWLAEQLGIPPSECHVGMFDLDQCERARSLASQRLDQMLEEGRDADFGD